MGRRGRQDRCTPQRHCRDLAGAGEWRGGSGCDYEVDIFTPATHSFRGEGLNYETGYGINGGKSGASGNMHLRYQDQMTEEAPKYGLQSTGPVRFVTQSPGGGGYGDPLHRAPARVLRDWRDEIISNTVMRETYGVVLSSDGRSVDNFKTSNLRLTMQESG